MNKRLIGTVAAAFLLSACKATNPPFTGPAKVAAKAIDYGYEEESADGLTVTYDPRVDILFVIDDSGSMKAHQENLSANINQFIDAIAKVKSIDFHIGYTFTHDSSRYGSVVPKVCPAETSASGRVNFEEPGTLWPLRGDSAPKDGRRFVTKADNFQAALKETLDPAKNPSMVKDMTVAQACPTGAEEEETFVPLLAALENNDLKAGVNKGFRREGALFIAVLVSDAKDASVGRGELTPERVAQRIARATGQLNNSKKRFRVYSVAVKPGSQQQRKNVTYNGQSCTVDPAYASGVATRYQNGKVAYEWPTNKTISEDENPLAALAILSEDEYNPNRGNQVLSICDHNYGAALAKFGNQVKQDTLTDIEIPLRRRPQITDDPKKKLQVFLDDMPLPQEFWAFELERLQVVVFGQKIDWNKYPNAKLHVSYTPVNDAGKNTRVWQ